MPEGKSRFKKLTSIAGWTTTSPVSKKPAAPAAPSIYLSTTETETAAGLSKYTHGENWESPFRGQEGEEAKPRVNLHQQFKEGNKLDGIQVPERFRRTTVIKEEKTTKVASTTDKDVNVKADESTKVTNSTKGVVAASDADADVDDAKLAKVDATDAESERPLTAEEKDNHEIDDVEEEDTKEATKEAVAETTDSADKELAIADEKETETVPAITDTSAISDKALNDAQDEADKAAAEVSVDADKYTPVNQEDTRMEQFKDQPAMLQRYVDLQAQGVASLTKAADDPNALIDVGGGLKIRQQDLLDMAAKRVAPVLANINEAVGKTRDDDEEKRLAALAAKSEAHETKLSKDLEKHKSKIEKKRTAYLKKIDEQKENISRMKKGVQTRSADHKLKVEGEIEGLHADSKHREERAGEQHESDKDTIHKNHDELVATKQQEIADSKQRHADTTTRIEELHEAKLKFHDHNSELQTKLEALQKQADEQQTKVDEVKGKYDAEDVIVKKNEEKIAGLRSKIGELKTEVETKRKERDGLKLAIEALAVLIAGYLTTLATLQNDKQVRSERLKDAQQKNKDWETHKSALALEVAAEHEKQRLQAQAQAQTKQIQLDLEFEQLQAEQARHEEKQRLLRLKEERESEARAQEKAEAERRERVEWREREKARIAEDRATREKEYALAEEKRKQELAALEAEIADIEANKLERAKDARARAERVAQEKEEELARLEAEHAENTAMYKEKLALEETQKKRLEEEGIHLARIKELQAQRQKAVQESESDTYPAEFQEKIKEQENKIKSLQQQIADDDDLYTGKVKTKELTETQEAQPLTKKKISNMLLESETSLNSENRAVVSKESSKEAAKLGSSWNRLKKKFSREESPKKAAVVAPKSKEAAKPKSKEAAKPKSKDSKLNGVGAGAAVAGGAAAGGAAAVAATSITPAASGDLAAPAASTPVSLNRTATAETTLDPKAADKVIPPPVEAKSSAQQQRTVAATTTADQVPAVPKGSDIARQPLVVSRTTTGTDSEYDTYSVYEEVTSEEYERNKNHPDYFQVTTEEFEKHNNKPLELA